MATDPDTIDDDVLDLAGFEDDAPGAVEGEEGDEQEGDDAPPATDNATIRQMRARIRELERETAVKNRPAPIEVGEKPRMDDPSINYDEDKFASELEAWTERKLAAASQPAPADDFKTIYQESFTAFNTARAELTAADPVAGEALLIADKALGVERTAAIVQALKGAAPAILAKIGSDDVLLDRFADMNDPWAMIAEATRLEKTPMARQRPELDTPVRGKAPANMATDKKLAKLEAAVANGGDRTELIRYRKQLTAKAA